MRTRKPPRRAVKVDQLEPAIELALEPGYFIRHGVAMSFVGGIECVEQRISAARHAALEHFGGAR